MFFLGQSTVSRAYHPIDVLRHRASGVVHRLPDRRLDRGPFQGAVLHVGLTPGTTAHRVLLAAEGLGPGSQSLRFTLPPDSTLAGSLLHAQYLVYEPMPTSNVSSSADVRMLLID